MAHSNHQNICWFEWARVYTILSLIKKYMKNKGGKKKMKKCKRLMCFVLAALMILPINVPAFALETQENGNRAKDEGNPFIIEVSTNKSEYSTLGVAKIDVTITNTSSEEIQNVSAEAVFKQLAPAGRKSETKKEVDTLKAGESISFSYKATINKEEYKLNFFQKVFLWIVRLFNGGFTAKNNEFDDGREYAENVTTIKFGKFNADNMVKVWYGKEKNNLTEKDFSDMEVVDTSLSKNVFNSDNFKELTIEDKKIFIEKLLNDLSDKGYIIKESISYFEDMSQFYFQYSCGIDYYISLNSHTEQHNTDSEDFKNLKVPPLVIPERSLRPTNLSTTNIKTEKSNWANAIVMYGWYKSDDTSSDHKELIDCYNSCTSEWSQSGLKTTLYTDTTVELYRNTLKGNDLIVIGEHGVGYTKKKDRYNVAFALQEEITDKRNRDYCDDIDEERVIKVNGHYAITPEFFMFYYKNNQLKNSIVYLGSCQGFGYNDWKNYGFSQAFEIFGGASSTLGYHDTVKISYQFTILGSLVQALSWGLTMKTAFDYATNTWGKSGPNGEYPIITVGNARLIDGHLINGVVQDKISKIPISNVQLSVCIQDTIIPLTTTKVEENGRFEFNLANGSYLLIFTHDNYENYACDVTINSSNVTLSEPILLTPSNSIQDNEYERPQIASYQAVLDSYAEHCYVNHELYNGSCFYCKYALVDINNDGEKELIVQDGTCEQDRTHHVYTMQNGTPKSIGEYNAWHLSLYNSDSKIIGVDGMGGDWTVYEISIVSGAVKQNVLKNTNIQPSYSSPIKFLPLTEKIQNGRDESTLNDASSSTNRLKYPTSQKYWVIFKEGFRNDRIELSTFDTKLQEGSFHIIWDGNLLLSNDGGMSRCEQFSIVNNQWNKDREYGILTDWATEIIASNVDIYDGEGNLIKAKTDYSKISMDMLQ